MKKPQELIIKLTIDATEALEILANVKSELERILFLEKEIAELKVQVSERPVTINISANISEPAEEIAREISKGLERASISHNL